MIDNLVGNAINYAPQESRVDLSLYIEQKTFVIDVLDQGSGIPIAERTRVFDRFYRVANASGNEGTGLGLAIVKAICERNAATVAIHDTELGIVTLLRVVWPQHGLALT